MVTTGDAMKNGQTSGKEHPGKGDGWLTPFSIVWFSARSISSEWTLLLLTAGT